MLPVVIFLIQYANQYFHYLQKKRAFTMETIIIIMLRVVGWQM